MRSTQSLQSDESIGERCLVVMMLMFDVQFLIHLTPRLPHAKKKYFLKNQSMNKQNTCCNGFVHKISSNTPNVIFANLILKPIRYIEEPHLSGTALIIFNSYKSQSKHPPAQDYWVGLKSTQLANVIVANST